MAFVPKKVPPPSLHLLGHPESDTEYRHFQVALEGGLSAPAVTTMPFDHAAHAFSPINAWWLADAALLAYWDESTAAERFQTGAGLSSTFFDRDGTQGYVASNGQFAIVAFRGTQPDEGADLWTDLDFVPRPWERGGRVHEGFMRGLNAVWVDVAGAVTRSGATRVWFTGHSLGGALAVLAADRFESAAGVYTIGSPRVGDPEFVGSFNARHENRSFRYVNQHDFVTRVPPEAVGFGHVDVEMRFDLDPGASLIPRALADHTPRLYATYMWNAIVAAVGPAAL